MRIEALGDRANKLLCMLKLLVPDKEEANRIHPTAQI